MVLTRWPGCMKETDDAFPGFGKLALHDCSEDHRCYTNPSRALYTHPHPPPPHSFVPQNAHTGFGIHVLGEALHHPFLFFFSIRFKCHNQRESCRRVKQHVHETEFFHWTLTAEFAVLCVTILEALDAVNVGPSFCCVGRPKYLICPPSPWLSSVHHGSIPRLVGLEAAMCAISQA